MPLRVAIQMDPIDGIHAERDSTLLLGLEAQRRGHKLYYYTPDNLSYLDGIITARGHGLTLSEHPKSYYRLGKETKLDLAGMDVVLMRQDPPFDMAYITNSYMLEKLQPKTLVVNNPTAVRDYPEKLFPALFKKFAPPTLISADEKAIDAFRKRHKDIIVKPLYGYSGYGIARFNAKDANLSSYLKELFAKERAPVVVQRFLPEMKSGERRLLFVDGKLSGVMGRIPGKDALHAGFQSGAIYIGAQATRRQLEIAKAVGPVLKKNGIIYAGVDVIGDWLTEINITSPGSLWGMRSVYGKHLAMDIWDAIERRLKTRRKR